MSINEERKHKVLQNGSTKLDASLKYKNMGFGSQPQEVEEKDAEEQDSVIYDRWKEPLKSSIVRYNEYFSNKLKRKNEIIKDNKFDTSVLKKLSKYEVNRRDIYFYKILSPAKGEEVVNYFNKIIDLKSFVFLKKDFNNTCISCTLNYEDSKKLIKYFEDILSCENWDVIENKFHLLRLVRGFNLVDNSDKARLSIHSEDDNRYYIFLFNRQTEKDEIIEILGLFSLELIEITNKSEGTYLFIQGDLVKLQDFLLFFELPEYVFSMELRTRIFSDDNAPANTKKELKMPNIVNEDIAMLPIVYLLDSGLPIDQAVVNPLIRSFVVDQQAIESLEKEYPTKDHAIQMAGIIIYGEQLHNITEYGDFVESDITPYARIYSLFVGTDKPKLGIWSLPNVLQSLSSDPRLKDQNIKIFNMSWNIGAPKQENENISFLSYMVDKYLFFHPEILVINSVGNYEGDKTGNFFTYPNCNINIPSDAINVLSVGSFGITDKVYIASGTSKNHYDKGMIKNQLKDGIDNWQGIKRGNNNYTKPDLLGLGDGRTSSTQIDTLGLITDTVRNGTSHATAYVSGASAKILGVYPEIGYAMTIENILLKFLGKSDQQYKIDLSKSVYEKIKERIEDIGKKSTLNTDTIIEKEDKNLHQRFSGGGILNVSKLFYNTKNKLTFIIEGEVEIGSMQYHRINLLDYLPKELMENNTLKFDGFLSFRGIPYLQDSIGYNMVNVIGGIWFASDYTNGDFVHDKKIKRSTNQTCSDRMRYTRNRIDTTTTGTSIFKDLLVQNNWNIDVILKGISRRKRENDIKLVIKEYFDELGSYPCVDRLQCVYDQYKSNGKTESINLSLIKVPYSVLISVEIQSDVDVYDTIDITQQVEL